MDVTPVVLPAQWPRRPGAVFSASCYIAIFCWGIAMGFGLSLAANHLLTMACLTSLIAGSIWWRVLYQRRRAAAPEQDFQGKAYREAQMESLVLAILAWIAPGLIGGAGWLWGVAVVLAFGYAYFQLTVFVVSKWPASP